MKEREDKNIEVFIDSVMSEASLESPSSDFTNQIMAKVEADKKNLATVYMPLISKRAWIVLSIGVVGIVLYTLFGKISSQLVWLQAIDFSFLSFEGFSLPSLSLSKSMSIILGLFSVMLFFQVLFLKKRFDRRHD